MIKLIPIENRHSQLLKFGANETFINNIGKIEELKYRVENVTSAYFYLPTISDYQILKGLNIIPIYCDGESFTVFGFSKSIKKIFHFELENDKIYSDYGTNWNLLLFDIPFEYFENDIDEKLNLDLFKKVGKELGFDKAEPMYKLLDIPLEKYNEKYKEVEMWKIEIAKQLEIL